MVERSPRAAARLQADDDGFTIIEVMVAMMIFAIIFLGVAYSTVTTLRMTADTRSREAAANLAAAEIDAVRAIGDPFQVQTTSYTKIVGGTKYIVQRKTGWVSASGTTEGCGSGTGTLQYKRVNVGVSWTGSLKSSAVARADTLLSPETRLNDPDFGSILVQVSGADALGEPCVGVSVTPATGGSALTQQPAATDGDGCSYAFLVSPGSYTVTISRAGYIDSAQSTTPQASVVVTEGGAASVQFQYDAAATYSVTYGTDERAVLPTDLSTTFFSAYGDFVKTGAPVALSLHPFASGYTAVVGKYVAVTETSAGCTAPDPAAWPARTVNGKHLDQGVRGTAAVPAGQTGTLAIPMGRLEVKAGSASMRLTSAVSAIDSGDPGCSVPTTHTYDSLPTSGSLTLAVPFGSWRLEERVGANWQTVPEDRYTVPSNAAGDIVDHNVVTVDPRGLAS